MIQVQVVVRDTETGQTYKKGLQAEPIKPGIEGKGEALMTVANTAVLHLAMEMEAQG